VHVLVGRKILAFLKDGLQVLLVGVEKSRLVGAAGMQVILDVVMDIEFPREKVKLLVFQGLQKASADAGFAGDIGQRDAARFPLLPQRLPDDLFHGLVVA
jgi:hypothetical protein